jgi:hypothetical protein
LKSAKHEKAVTAQKNEADGDEDAEALILGRVYANRGKLKCAFTGLTAYGVVERVHEI